MVKASNWLAHLEYEWESPVWRHWMRFFSGGFRFVRHDERGFGMTDQRLHIAVRSRRHRRTARLGALQGGNAEIAERLSISDKTVRNHVSHLFDKLGVWTRAQAIVFARDRGFAGRLPTANSATPKM